MDSEAATDESPTGSLCRCAVGQPREPGEGDDNGPAVGEVDLKRVVSGTNVLPGREDCRQRLQCTARLVLAPDAVQGICAIIGE